MPASQSVVLQSIFPIMRDLSRIGQGMIPKVADFSDKIMLQNQ